MLNLSHEQLKGKKLHVTVVSRQGMLESHWGWVRLRCSSWKTQRPEEAHMPASCFPPCHPWPHSLQDLRAVSSCNLWPRSRAMSPNKPLYNFLVSGILWLAVENRPDTQRRDLHLKSQDLLSCWTATWVKKHWGLVFLVCETEWQCVWGVEVREVVTFSLL